MMKLLKKILGIRPEIREVGSVVYCPNCNSWNMPDELVYKLPPRKERMTKNVIILKIESTEFVCQECKSLVKLSLTADEPKLTKENV
jgi:DNA-directed RNA polymerase subunit RPC12/RpoP